MFTLYFESLESDGRGSMIGWLDGRMVEVDGRGSDRSFVEST